MYTHTQQRALSRHAETNENHIDAHLISLTAHLNATIIISRVVVVLICCMHVNIEPSETFHSFLLLLLMPHSSRRCSHRPKITQKGRWYRRIGFSYSMRRARPRGEERKRAARSTFLHSLSDTHKWNRQKVNADIRRWSMRMSEHSGRRIVCRKYIGELLAEQRVRDNGDCL